MLNFRDQTRTGVLIAGMFADGIHISAVAFVLLQLGPFARRLWAIVSCSVIGKGEQ